MKFALEPSNDVSVPRIDCRVSVSLSPQRLPEMIELLVHQGHHDIAVSTKGPGNNLAWVHEMERHESFVGSLMELVEALLRVRGASTEDVIPVLRALHGALLPNSVDNCYKTDCLRSGGDVI